MASAQIIKEQLDALNRQVEDIEHQLNLTETAEGHWEGVLDSFFFPFEGVRELASSISSAQEAMQELSKIRHGRIDMEKRLHSLYKQRHDLIVQAANDLYLQNKQPIMVRNVAETTSDQFVPQCPLKVGDKVRHRRGTEVGTVTMVFPQGIEVEWPIKRGVSGESPVLYKRHEDLFKVG